MNHIRVVPSSRPSKRCPLVRQIGAVEERLDAGRDVAADPPEVGDLDRLLRVRVDREGLRREEHRPAGQVQGVSHCTEADRRVERVARAVVALVEVDAPICVGLRVDELVEELAGVLAAGHYARRAVDAELQLLPVEPLDEGGQA